MSDNDIYPEDPQDITDLDDVEGHGLKEVAAGLGAAAVLAGGAAGATTLASAHADVHPSKGGPGITIQVDDPIGTTVQATDNAIASAQALRDGALSTTEHAVASTAAAAGQKVDATVTSATDIAGATVAWAGDVKQGTVQTAKAVNTTVKHDVSATTTMATTKTEHAVDATTTMAGNKVESTSATATGAGALADRKVATVLNVVTTTAAGGVHNAVVTLKAVNAGAGIESSSAGGWVLVKAGDTVLAQVHMTGGTATASWTMPVVGDHSVSISYTGDSVFAPSLRAITL